MPKLELASPQTNIQGLHPAMQIALKRTGRVWDRWKVDTLTITHGLDGIHSVGSLHPMGLAVDLRIWPFDKADLPQVVAELREALPGYDVILHPTHIHIEAQWVLDSVVQEWKRWQ